MSVFSLVRRYGCERVILAMSFYRACIVYTCLVSIPVTKFVCVSV